MTVRKRIGYRRHQASFERHNGNQDDAGNLTYGTQADWVSVFAGWPVELTTTSGTEDTRGRQVQAETTHVLYGEWYGGQMAAPSQRCRVNGLLFDVVSAYDVEGTQQELRVELKRVVDG